MHQGHDTRMLGKFAFPRVDNHEVVAVESDALLPPNVAPGEGCSDNCEEFLPLDRHMLLMMWLLVVVKPLPLKVPTTSKRARSVFV